MKSEKIVLLKERALFLRSIREYFYRQGLIEVDTPIMSQFGNPDPALLNFESRYHGPGRLYRAITYLITSPEYHMKRLLAEGLGSCYYLGKVFRDGELSARHNPEFTLLEWYRVGYSLEELMDEVVALISHLAEESLEVERYTYREAFRRYLNLDPFSSTVDYLNQWIRERGVTLSTPLSDRDELLDLIVSYFIEPAFTKEKLTLLYHYPESQASLATVITDQSGDRVGKRFEVYWKGLELANGYEELTDSAEQRRRFLKENRERERAVKIDEKLLEVLDQLPFCSGVAVGIDRLLMAKKGITQINDVIPFAFEEA